MFSNWSGNVDYCRVDFIKKKKKPPKQQPKKFSSYHQTFVLLLQLQSLVNQMHKTLKVEVQIPPVVDSQCSCLDMFIIVRFVL